MPVLPSPFPNAFRLAALALTALPLLAACGRRGPLEAPVPAGASMDPAGARRAATAARGPTGRAVEGEANTPGLAGIDDPDDQPDTLLNAAVPTPPRLGGSRRKVYTIPKEPFPLDPLL